MMSLTLPILSPPSSSLLPSSLADHIPQAPQPQTHLHAHRRKHLSHNSRGTLALLSQDERTIQMRKTAIAMYGYSWLKPAGCGKTMLGRREEEVEREEVERQLREVEMQERNAMEAEEAERVEALRQQAQGGGTAAEEGERNLDDEVPDAEVQEDEEDYLDDDEQDGEEEGMGGDLDDEVPNAESSWVYDTTRDPDTESEEADYNEAVAEHRGARGTGSTANGPLRLQNHARQIYNANNETAYLAEDDAATTQAMVDAMLDEDELGEMEHDRDLDDDIPDMDGGMDVDMDEELEDRDLDDEVPEADDEEVDEEWQHTDTELEDSEMDISVLPPNPSEALFRSRPTPGSARSRQRSSGNGPGTTHEAIRRTSGNVMMPPPSAFATGAQSSSRPQGPTSSATSEVPHQMRPHDLRRRAIGQEARKTPQVHYHTPVISTEDSVSNLINTNESSIIGHTTHLGGPARMMELGQSSAIPATNSPTGDNPDNADPQRNRHSWLNPAGARRNLFGGLTRQASGPGPAVATGPATTSPGASLGGSMQRMTRAAANTISSGGLFTPGPRTDVAAAAGDHGGEAAAGTSMDDDIPRSRTRSGRLLGGMHVSRRPGVGRRRRDVEET